MLTAESRTHVPIRATADSDGDGQSDWQEIQAGTDPNDKSSWFGIESVVVNADASRTVTWKSVAGRTYHLQVKHRLTDAAWTELGVDVVAQGETLSVQDTAVGTNGERFYRVRLVH